MYQHHEHNYKRGTVLSLRAWYYHHYTCPSSRNGISHLQFLEGYRKIHLHARLGPSQFPLFSPSIAFPRHFPCVSWSSSHCPPLRHKTRPAPSCLLSDHRWKTTAFPTGIKPFQSWPPFKIWCSWAEWSVRPNLNLNGAPVESSNH